MKAFLDKIENHLIWIYPLLALVIYFPTRRAGFVHDFTGWYERYQEFGWSGITHCFSYHRLQHVMHFLHFLIYKAFDHSPFPWYFIYATLFGFNCYLVFLLGKALVKFFKSTDQYIPFLASFLFLIHPYQVTAVTWKVCFHYLLATLFVSAIVLFTLKWLQNPSRKKIIFIYTCYVLSLFVHELTIAVPLITLLLTGILFLEKHHATKKVFIYLVLPQFLVLPLYFSATPYLLQDTGKELIITEHKIDVKKQTSGVFEYMSKHTLFTRYWSHPAKEQWKQRLNSLPYVIGGWVLALLLLSLFIYFYQKLPPEIKLFGFCLMAFVAAIGPFTSAYIAYILYAWNDMYGFSASVYIIIALVAFVRWLPRRIGNVIFILYMTLSFIFMVRTIYYWHESGYVMESLIDDFRWYDEKKVYVLMSPDNFKGALMMTNQGHDMLADHLFVKNQEHPNCEIDEIMQFNMAKRTDGVSVIVHSPDSLSVKLNQWGTWFWRNGLGATNYETEDYRIKLSPPYYRFKRKNMHEDAVYIYQDGAKWKEVEW